MNDPKPALCPLPILSKTSARVGYFFPLNTLAPALLVLPMPFAGRVFAAPSERSQCSISENQAAAQIFIDVCATHELYAAANRDRIELQQRYPLKKITAMISRGENTTARQRLDVCLSLLNRALDETKRAKEAVRGFRARLRRSELAAGKP